MKIIKATDKYNLLFRDQKFAFGSAEVLKKFQTRITALAGGLEVFLWC